MKNQVSSLQDRNSVGRYLHKSLEDRQIQGAENDDEYSRALGLIK